MGVFVMNLAGERATCVALLEWMRAVFREAVIAVPVEGGNYVVFGQDQRHFDPQWKWLVSHAKRLESFFGLNFPSYVQELRRCYQLDVR